MTVLEAALHYASLGWSVIPVDGKRPLLPSWAEYQGRRATNDEIKGWFTRWPGAGVAIVCGTVSGGLVVVDVDTEAGARAIAPYLAPTLSAATPGGGTHYYYTSENAPPNAVRFLEGCDVRAEGGIVVAPPSPHASGGRYEWKSLATSPAPLPPALLTMIRGARGSPPAARGWGDTIPEGERDAALTSRAGSLLRAGATAAETADILMVMNAALARPPLPAEQVQKIVRSIDGRETARTAAPADDFTMMTQREMVTRFSEDPSRWTVEEWLPEASCGLLVAPPGNYKTWMLMALTASVATGRPFLGKYAVNGRGPVIVIQQEDPWWMLESRLARMLRPDPPGGAGDEYELDCRHTEEFFDMPVHWYTSRQLNFANDRTMAALEREVERVRPRLVVVDPLYTAAKSEDYMAEAAQRMGVLKRMRDKYGTSFVVAHHTTVAGAASESRAAIWGSQFLNAWLEFSWRMPDGDDKGNVVVRSFKDSEIPRRIRLRFKIDRWSFAVDVDDAPASIKTRIEELILTGAKLGSDRDIARELGVSRQAVHKAMKGMTVPE